MSSVGKMRRKTAETLQDCGHPMQCFLELPSREAWATAVSTASLPTTRNCTPTFLIFETLHYGKMIALRQDEALYHDLLAAVAEEIGVSADPEVELRRLNSSNPFLVVASDGVFEFLTNQRVVEMVRPTFLEKPHQHFQEL